jgi:hypothetical protein
MILHLQRFARRPDYTIGRLYIDGAYFCDVLEDADRGLSNDMTVEQIQALKEYGRTAIPTGIYDVLLTYSPKFANRPWATKYRGMLPLINGIPGYSRVFIHVGNTAADTDGCPLLGKNKVVGKVIQSTATFQEFMDRHIMRALARKDKIRIKITRTYGC